MTFRNYHPMQGRVHVHNGYQTLQPTGAVCQIVQSFWQLNVPSGSFIYHSIPDNCVDWITSIGQPQESVFIPPFLAANPFALQGPVSYFGVRFQLLGYQVLIPHPLGTWASELQGVALADLLSDKLSQAMLEQLCAQPDFYSRCNTMANWLLQVANAPTVDTRLAHFLAYSTQNRHGSTDLSERQCHQFGLSARQLRRLVRHHLGVSPKAFQQVLRFQHTLQQLEQTPEQNAWAESYYDQSHFIRDCQRFIGMTYPQFRTMSVLYNAVESK